MIRPLMINYRWHTFPLTDIVWCMFHYGQSLSQRTQRNHAYITDDLDKCSVRLYISAFSFQAHVARASERAEMEASRLPNEDDDPNQAWRPPESLFPRGGAVSGIGNDGILTSCH